MHPWELLDRMGKQTVQRGRCDVTAANCKKSVWTRGGCFQTCDLNWFNKTHVRQALHLNWWLNISPCETFFLLVIVTKTGSCDDASENRGQRGLLWKCQHVCGVDAFQYIRERPTDSVCKLCNADYFILVVEFLYLMIKQHYGSLNSLSLHCNLFLQLSRVKLNPESD